MFLNSGGSPMVVLWDSKFEAILNVYEFTID
jgi:hypothetical protein